jgi:hypothetical protein
MTEAADKDSPSPSARIVALNGKLRRACYSIRVVALGWIMLDGGLSLWNFSDRDAMLQRISRSQGVDVTNVSSLRYWSAALVMLLTMAVAGFFVAQLWRLTHIYLQGKVFALEAARAMRHTALAGFGLTLYSCIALPIAVGLISTDIFPTLAFYELIKPLSIFYLLISAFLLALSVIFEAAAEIVEDHAHFI